MSGDRSKRIAELNDRFRAAFGNVVISGGIPGQIVVTSGIGVLPEITQVRIFARVAIHEEFSEDNDPYGGHDFGSFDKEGAGKIFWKIDYYEDASCEFGSEAPEDPSRSFRVLTIMLADEY